MEKLHQFYTKGLRIFAVIIGFLSALVVNYLPELWQKIFISGAVIGLLFSIAEWLVREKLWRIGIFHRSIDYEDDWKCITFYESVTTNDVNKTCDAKFPVHHDAKIVQDAKKIDIKSSSGHSFTGWFSSIMDFDDDKVRYAYEVTYSSGESAEGIEHLSVRQRYPDKKSGKPILLIGDFAHCAKGQSCAYRGIAVFCSSVYLKKIKITNLTLDDKIVQEIEKLKSQKTVV